MKTLIKIGSACVAVLLGAMAWPHSVSAQDYPQRPVTVVVGAAAGGSSDTAMRIIQERLSQALGQQVIIENVPGAGGMTASARVARAAPDGYTVLIQQTGLVTLPALQGKKLTFDVEKDLIAVGLVNRAFSYLLGRSTLPANNLAELVTWMKGPGKPAKFAHPGAGSMGALSSVLFAKAVDVEVNLIPYRGVAPALNDLVGGHVDLTTGSAAVAPPLLRSGSVKAYAISSGKRDPSAPEVPTFTELGYPGLERPLWHALFLPAGTPAAIVTRLNAALRDTLADPAIQKSYAEKSIEAYPPAEWTVEAAAAHVKAELDYWTKVIRDNNIQAE